MAMARENNVTFKLFLFLFFMMFIKGQRTEQCYVNTTAPYLSFSIKTSYNASRSPQSQRYISKNCSPIYMWALIRHGTRYPGREFINAMKKLKKLKDNILLNHKEGRGKLCLDDLKNLENWSTNVTADQYYQLTPQGMRDHIFLAQKLKEMFPELLTSTSKNSFVFQTSTTPRTRDSALIFTNELLNTTFTDMSGNNITENDSLLHINDHCPKFLKEVYNSSSTLKENNLMQESAFIQKILYDISTHLGFDQLLPYNLIDLMYNICALESAWYVNSRPAFCAAFSPTQQQVFEYLEDLLRFYQLGYGNSINEQMGSVIVQDMMKSLLNAANNQNDSKKATFYFSHAEAIYPLIVKLGLFHDDEPLKHDNYEKMMRSRKWKSALFNGFSSNIVAVLYKCDGSEGSQNKVIFYANERQVVPPKCRHIPCLLEDLLQNFQEVFNKTQANLNFCRIADPVQRSSGTTIFLKNLNVCLILLLYRYGIGLIIKILKIGTPISYF